ncbi:MAG TPA: acetate/propionate family kinase [Candidatus Limnocylindrales bacterium]|nr:acetate/propionate family kinase [Candidatus Limnocylindrales bacterium]
MALLSAPIAGRVLVLNAGSATLKGTVLDLPDETALFEQTIDWSAAAPPAERRAAINAVLDAAAADAGIAPESLAAVAHRVVHGGERFSAPVRIDDEVIDALTRVVDLAPLHNPLAVATIEAARERLPSTPQVALFDTAFHATMPLAARRYPVPDRWTIDYGIRRYGFHGLSVEWAVGRASSLLDRPVDALRLVVAHLGGGCSVTAVEAGRSIDTSMGLTPLEGLMMGTRAGSIDPGIVFRLLRAGLPADDIERDLDHGSGLLGVGGSADMRALEGAAADGDERARMAIALFVRRAAAGIAAAVTTLPSIDAIVFTGGIGEHAVAVRRAICERLGSMGVPVPPTEPVGGAERDAVIAAASDGVAILRVHAREDVVMARGAITALTTRP